MAHRVITAIVLAALAWAGSALPVQATEIATGTMLGPGYDQRAFYVRDAPDRPWRKTYSTPDYRAEAQGRLMNIGVRE